MDKVKGITVSSCFVSFLVWHYWPDRRLSWAVWHVLSKLVIIHWKETNYSSTSSTEENKLQYNWWFCPLGRWNLLQFCGRTAGLKCLQAHFHLPFPYFTAFALLFIVMSSLSFFFHFLTSYSSSYFFFFLLSSLFLTLPHPLTSAPDEALMESMGSQHLPHLKQTGRSPLFFWPTLGLALIPSTLPSITTISNSFICKKLSVLHRLPHWFMLARPSFLQLLFDVYHCSTCSLLLSRHFWDNRFWQR